MNSKDDLDLNHRHKSIYLLPNAFTTGNLFAGFYAIVASMTGVNFSAAAISIFVAMVLDAMDGRVARLTNTQSSFGEQYDSLSDMVSFGVAPALLMYSYVLNSAGRWGWVAAFIYVACAAIRLARFNANIVKQDSSFFQGMPSPSASALMAGFVWLVEDNKIPSNDVMPIFAFVLTVYAGLMMISDIPFLSGKNLSVVRYSPRIIVPFIVMAFAFIAFDPPILLFLCFIIYSLSGWVTWYRRKVKASELRKKRHL